jgi:hypothetical protein
VSDRAPAGEFPVRRGPAREALLILAGEGSIEHMYNRGFPIPTFIGEDLREKQFAVDAGFALDGLAECPGAEVASRQAGWTMSGDPWLASALRRVCRPSFTCVSPRGLSRRDLAAERLSVQYEQYPRRAAGGDWRTAEEYVRFHFGLGG